MAPELWRKIFSRMYSRDRSGLMGKISGRIAAHPANDTAKLSVALGLLTAFSENRSRPDVIWNESSLVVKKLLAKAAKDVAMDLKAASNLEEDEMDIIIGEEEP